jgi:two-component system, NarL family, response regulator LiaR
VRTRLARRTSNGAHENGADGNSAERLIRVVIADADGLARNALRSALENGHVSVVGQAADIGHAVSLATRCQPDVMILDGALPPDGGLAAMQELALAAPDARAIVLGESDDDDGALRALSQGAAGYLSRGIDLESLPHAVVGVAQGEAAISRALAARLIARVRELSEGLAGMRPVRSPLTTREWEVLDMLRTKASTAQIAEELVLSPDTVHSHVQHIMRKLDAHSRAEAVELAESAGAQFDSSA